MIYETILKEKGRRGWSAYKLAHVSGLPMRTVQEYIAGTYDLTARRIDKLLAALDLRIVAKPKQKKGR